MRAKASIFIPVLMAGAVFGQDVTYNFDRSADFAAYKTYKWVNIKEAVPLDSLSDQDIKSAVDAELVKKGLMKTEGDDADLLIDYQFALNQEKQFTSYSTDFGYGPSWRYGWYGGMGSTTTTGQTYTINIGAVGLDMYDAKKKQLVWRGEVSKTLDPKAKPDKRRKNIQKAVAKLLKNYPPPVQKG